MKTFLLYKNRDFDLEQTLPWNEQALTQDLELTTLFDAMALGDKFIWDVVRKAVLLSLHDVDAIRYRQAILQDCLTNPAIIRDLYAIAVEAIEGERKVYWGFFRALPHDPAAIGRGAGPICEAVEETEADRR